MNAASAGRQWLVWIAVFVTVPGVGLAQAPAPQAVDVARAKALVAGLADANTARRDQALKELRAIGAPALVPVLMEIHTSDKLQGKLVPLLTACRTIAFNDPPDFDRLMSVDDKLTIPADVLSELKAGIKSGDAEREKVCVVALSLLCFSTNGSAVAGITRDAKELKEEQLVRVLTNAAGLQVKLVDEKLKLMVAPTAQVKLMPARLYQDDILALRRYGSLVLPSMKESLQEATDRYQSWENQKSNVALVASDREWQEYVGHGCKFYTMRHVLRKVVQDLERDDKK